ncbi:MAG: ATP-dependent DNA ligase, partial [Acidimicrobiia bacterium]
FVAFDLLSLDDVDLRPVPLGERRRLLEQALGSARPPVHLTPATTDPATAADWFSRFEGAGLDGVVAKPLRLPYREGERVMLKVKHHRVADCVVAGFRWHKSGPVIGSLLLGLYEDGDASKLQHVGVTSAFSMAVRRAMVDHLAPYREGALAGHPWASWAAASAEAPESRMPGGQSRWNAGRDLAWEPLRAELVAEVSYDHLQGNRFRHSAQLVRWRPDRTAESCTYSQLERATPMELGTILGR